MSSKTIKDIDNENQNSSMWVIKKNLKDLKIALEEKYQKLNSLSRDFQITQEKSQAINKPNLDKNHMKEMLDRASTLHKASIRYQQNMAQSRETLHQLATRLESIRNTEKETGNFIVEEIKLIDETKRIKDNITIMEIEYSRILEELAQVASEITKIDDMINNTPKSQITEAKLLDLTLKETTKSIDLLKNDIEKTKEKIHECQTLLGKSTESNEVSKIFDNALKVIVNEVWTEESENMVSECKRFSEKVLKQIDKERTNFYEVTSKNTEEIINLKEKIQYLEKCLKDEKHKSTSVIELNSNSHTSERDNQKINDKLHEMISLEKRILEMTRDLANVENIIAERNKVLQDLSRKQSEFQLPPKTPEFAMLNQIGIEKSDKPTKLCQSSHLIKNPDQSELYAKILNKLADILKLPLDAKKIYSHLELLTKEIDKFKGKCQRFKEKKDELIKQYMQKNYEISEKIKKINQEKIFYKAGNEEVLRMKQEIKGEEGMISKLKLQKEELENEKAKMEIKVKALREECDIFQDKRYKLIVETGKLQEKFDMENEKYDEIIKKAQESQIRIDSNSSKYEEIEKYKDLAASQHSKLLQDIESKQKILLDLEQKIEETRKLHKTETGNLINTMKNYESRLQTLDCEMQKKTETLHDLTCKIDQIKLGNYTKEPDSCNSKKPSLSKYELKTSSLEKTPKYQSEDLKAKELKFYHVNRNIKDKEAVIQKLENQYLTDLEKAEKLKSFSEELENKAKNLNKSPSKNPSFTLKSDFSNTNKPSFLSNPLRNNDSSFIPSKSTLPSKDHRKLSIDPSLNSIQSQKSNSRFSYPSLPRSLHSPQAHTKPQSTISSPINLISYPVSTSNKHKHFSLSNQVQKLENTKDELEHKCWAIQQDINYRKFKLDKLQTQETENLSSSNSSQIFKYY
ncbi:hypothetical protein SteCoe_8360 [Stentor coeruleus]|uniref:Uncharacterized protein n=1 Tax=Stentor coeruleus TaxID=5963 RepID=A0A1R2CKB4_9CILI|nr:hypothetical protein SteCoe_8360 [Stentor coeruleus]